MEFQDAKRALKAIYGHSDSESSNNKRHKTLHVMFGGSWAITSRHVVKTLRREIAAVALAPKAAPHHKWVETLIGFNASDCPKSMAGTGQLPLLVSLTISSIKLYHVLIDGGAALNLISLAAFKSGPSVGYAVRLHLPPGHIRDGRELSHGERPLRCCGGQPPIQRHSGQTSSVPVHGDGSLRVLGSKYAIPQCRPQDLGGP
jgi:hypothetical protein